MDAKTVIDLARKNIGGDMESSARLCLADAERVFAAGYPYHAAIHAMKSMAYSIGILHPDYAKGWEACDMEGSPLTPGYLWSGMTGAKVYRDETRKLCDE